MSDLYPVTVLVPHHNGPELLNDCLSSLKELDYPKDLLEIVVVDDASTDDSPEFLRKRFPDVKVLRNETNKGFALSINKGVAEARTEWTAFLNNDTRVHPQWLKALIDAVDVSSRVVSAASKVLDWDGGRVTFQGGYLSYAGKGFEDACPLGSPGEIRRRKKLLFASGCAMIVHRPTFLQVGGFDEQFFGFFEDTDFGWRLNLMGYDVVLAPSSVVFHRGHASFDAAGRTRRLALIERNALWQVFKNYGEDAFLPALSASLVLAIKRSEILGRHGRQRMTGFYGEELPSFGDRLFKQRLQDTLCKAPYADEMGENLSASAGFLDGLDLIAQKRTKIQKDRRVSDKEILSASLFPDPYRPWALDDEMYRILDQGGYGRIVRETAKIFGLAEFFEVSP